MIVPNSDSEEPRRPKVMIVEDNATFRQSFKENLQMLFPNLNIQEVTEGNECMEKVAAFHPELIFMDIRLPGENGLSLTKKIKAKYPEMQVIVITSYDSPEYQAAAIESGASHFVSKDSLSLDDIEALIKSIILDR